MKAKEGFWMSIIQLKFKNGDSVVVKTKRSYQFVKNGLLHKLVDYGCGISRCIDVRLMLVGVC